MNTENQCVEQVHDRGTIWPTYHQCTRKGTVQEGGKWWCKVHAPSAVKARAELAAANFEAKYEAEHRKWQAQIDHPRLLAVLEKIKKHCEDAHARFDLYSVACDDILRIIETGEVKA